jgi:hypothetical protein
MRGELRTSPSEKARFSRPGGKEIASGLRLPVGRIGPA